MPSGVYLRTKEVSEATKKKMKEVWNRPGAREKMSKKMKIVMNRPEVKKKMSEKMKRFWANPIRREKKSEEMKIVMSRPGVREKISQRMTEVMNRPEVKEKMKRLWTDPVYRKKVLGENNPGWKGDEEKMKEKENSSLTKLMINWLKVCGVDLDTRTIDARAFDLHKPLFQSFLKDAGFEIPLREDVEKEFQKSKEEGSDRVSREPKAGADYYSRNNWGHRVGSQSAQIDEFVREYLAKGKALEAEAIARESGLAGGRVFMHLKHLKKRGLIKERIIGLGGR